MTEVRQQRSAVRNQRAEINCPDAECAERFLCACASAVKPISDFRLLISVLCALLFALSFPAEAQQPTKIHVIGILMSGSPEPRRAVLEAFRQGLQDLGYIEGKNIAIEYRFSEGRDERLPELAAELVQLKVDIIVTSGIPPPLAAKKATKTIPIVMGVVGDAIGTGLVDSLARPGGNVTGLTLLGPELGGKRLEILKETVPKLLRVAVLLNPANRGTTLYRKEVEDAARSLGVELHLLEARRPNELASALSETKIGRSQALITLNDTMFFSQQVQIANLAIKTGLPAMFPESEYVNAGGLMSYGPNLPDLFRRAATYVDKILKGTKPADLPVEQPTKFELVINLKTVKQIGLTVPPNVLARADRVIR
jgi:putative ABC transport system substrate-binding protein